ncbi:MAG: NADH-quinone oxidoreductase subunit NuoH [Ignavibacteriae bacterium]|nr:NADH-quinone oxidoreductase subunit NuoH [Ignavibacteriota bacterium]
MSIWIPLIKIAVIIGTILNSVIVLVWAERRVSAFMQDRIGPNRVGPFGLLQSFADVVKLVMKEDIIPRNAYKVIHDLAPIISIGIAFSTFAVIPIGNSIELFGENVKLQVADVNVGILYILAITSLGVYGLTLAGWSSNNKYSLLGGLRSSAQLISYELSMGLSIIGVLMIAGTLRLDQIVELQASYIGGWLPAWNIILQPVAFITFVVAAFAETNRLPFDLPEAEPELVGGYHTEYTGLKFGLFFLAEYANMITSSAIIVTLFLGGWHFPYIENLGISPFWLSLLQVGAFCVKVVGVLLFFIVIRWTLPRFRYDQLMNLGWKVMLPLTLANVMGTGLVILAWPWIRNLLGLT